MPKKPAPDRCPHCGGVHPLTDQQVEELRPRLLEIFRLLGGTRSFQEDAYSAWVETLPMRFDHCEVTGPDWFLAQAQHDISRFVQMYGALQASRGKAETIQ